ncbi:MAG: homoserine kinase [Actinomycetes bacterium]
MPGAGSPDLAAAVRVRVPATSANLGPGFDSLGLALAVHDEVVVRPTGPGLVVTVDGEGADDVPRDETNLLVRALRLGLDRLGVGADVGLEVSCALRVPHARGLGSSAAAIVAGLVAARALVPDGSDALPTSALLALAHGLEGHPDNVAATLLGGLTIAWTAQDGSGTGAPAVHALHKEPVADLAPTVLVPPGRASTHAARTLLPAQVPYADAVRNTARAALLVEALTHRPDLLLTATEDALHQQYRRPAMPESIALVDDLRAKGQAAVLSGAGPSVLVLGTLAEREDASALCPRGWVAWPLAVDRDGARVLPAD